MLTDRDLLEMSKKYKVGIGRDEQEKRYIILYKDKQYDYRYERESKKELEKLLINITGKKIKKQEDDIKLIKVKTIKDDVYDYTIWGLRYMDIVLVNIYAGYESFYRTIWDKKRNSYKWVVRYVKNNEYEYEHYNSFREAVARGKTIIKTKLKQEEWLKKEVENREKLLSAKKRKGRKQIIFTNSWRRWDGAEMKEIMEKVEGGIIDRLYINGKLALEVFSKRPYKLGQPCDGTIDKPVLALFYKFCKDNKLNPNYLYSLAYWNEDVPDWIGIVKEAEEQGVEYPTQWGKKEFEGLIESLTEINYHSLVNVLMDNLTLDKTGRWIYNYNITEDKKKEE